MLSRRALLLLLAAAFLLTACDVENLAGVELATVAIPPTKTVAPTSTPNPLAMRLPQRATKEFVGTTITINYPDNWEVNEYGEALTVFDPAAPEGDGMGVTLFVQLTSRMRLDDSLETLAPVAMNAYLSEIAHRGYIPEESAPSVDETYAFLWGGHDSALFNWESEDGQIRGINVLVMDSERERYVIIFAQTGVSFWEEFEPTWQAMMASVVLNGEPLPAADILAAYQAAGAA